MDRELTGEKQGQWMNWTGGIIELLQLDGRASNAKVAREVGVSEATVRRRLSRLIQQDVLRITAVPNLEKLGYGTTALIRVQTSPGI